MNTKEELREAILLEFKQVQKLAPADYTENCTNVVMSLVENYVVSRESVLLSRVRDIIENTKTDETLLGCPKHWSDDSSAICTCDEQESAVKGGQSRLREAQRTKLDQLSKEKG